MSNLTDKTSSTSAARTEQVESKMMVLRSTDIVKLTNMELIRAIVEPRGWTPDDYHYSHRSKRLCKDHDIQTVFVPTALSLLKKHRNWILCGDVCISVEDQSGFHLKLKLSAGNLAESVKLVADLEEYQKKSGNERDSSSIEDEDEFIRKIDSFVCTITLLDKNLKNIGDTRCFQLVNQFNSDSYHFHNENFCSQSTLMLACQISPAGANNNLGISGDFEFIQVKIETVVCLKEISQGTMNGYSCYTQGFQRKQFSSKDYRLLKSEVVAERPLFTEIVVLKAGGINLPKFYVHKDILIQESPVFARMFDVCKGDAITGEVTLKDCSVSVLEAFICFLYQNGSELRFKERVDILLGVLTLALQKGIKRIVQRVKEMIISVGNKLLNLKLALRMFTAGDFYEMPELKFRAVQWIKCNKVQLQTAEGRKHVQAVVDANKDLASSIIAEILTIL